MLTANEVDGVKGGDELIEKCGKLSKTGKLFKSGNSKGKKSAKFKKQSKSENSPNFNTIEANPSFLTPKARATFNYLQLAFTKTPIFGHFHPKCHIWIEINTSDYAIGDDLSQLTSKTSLNRIVTKVDLGQWYLVAVFSRKMIPVKTWYKTHNGKLLAIVKAFKT